ncbi:MAG: hypothetical protein MUE78_00355 [Ilumatobacteraceae bacterium]|nr:hypothetical protein [Ilumatobacteraceae bacterium]
MSTPADGLARPVAAPVVAKPLKSSREPVPGAGLLRIALVTCLAAMTIITLAAGLLVLLLWANDRNSGLLSRQVQDTWDRVRGLADAQLLVAIAVVVFATVWFGLATYNVARASAKRRYSIAVALTLPAALVGVWLIGDRIVEPSEEWPGEVAGVALQALVLAVPLVVYEYVASAVDARRNPARATYLIGVGSAAMIQLLEGLSTIEVGSGPGEWPLADDWGRLASYLLIGALLQLVGTLFANEACRSLEDAAQLRYELRNQFTTSVLNRASPTGPLVPPMPVPAAPDAAVPVAPEPPTA